MSSPRTLQLWLESPPPWFFLIVAPLNHVQSPRELATFHPLERGASGFPEVVSETGALSGLSLDVLAR